MSSPHYVIWLLLEWTLCVLLFKKVGLSLLLFLKNNLRGLGYISRGLGQVSNILRHCVTLNKLFTLFKLQFLGFARIWGWGGVGLEVLIYHLHTALTLFPFYKACQVPGGGGTCACSYATTNSSKRCCSWVGFVIICSFSPWPVTAWCLPPPRCACPRAPKIALL